MAWRARDSHAIQAWLVHRVPFCWSCCGKRRVFVKERGSASDILLKNIRVVPIENFQPNSGLCPHRCHFSANSSGVFKRLGGFHGCALRPQRPSDQFFDFVELLLSDVAAAPTIVMASNWLTTVFLVALLMTVPPAKVRGNAPYNATRVMVKTKNFIRYFFWRS